ncbi:MAG TPA: glycoside hydrolase family 31 protein [Pseudonocardiaceae bacterium]
MKALRHNMIVLLPTCALVAGIVSTPALATPAPSVAVHAVAGAVDVTVRPTATAPGYALDIATDSMTMTTRRAGHTVLATAGGTTGGLRFYADGAWQHATRLTGWTWQGGVLTLTAATTEADTTVQARITPRADRYALSWDVHGGAASQLGLAYDLKSAGHWYGQGETATPQGGPGTNEPWPLDSGDVHDSDFGPASYSMIDPFWYTSASTGLWVDTGQNMDVAINDGSDGLGRFTVDSGATYDATVFVESTPSQVYRDYVGIVGKPAKSDADATEYTKPLWNTWAQFYTGVDQQKVLSYAQGLHQDGIDAHTIQIDDKWESDYGNLTFDSAKFPDPAAMSTQIHDMGFNLGLWTTLWINLDSANYQYAVDHGYLLKDKTDQTKPCTVTWWNGTAGIIDLANPAAEAWYVNNLKTLMSAYHVDGFKFDTRFFDDACAPDAGYQPEDYQTLGAQMADQFDLQGAGIRVHWSPAAHQGGFVTRQVDKGTGWDSLAASVTQNLAISTIGYPFVETDMIGGSSAQPPPTKDVLVRWAESAALMPLMYSSTSPVGTIDVTTGKPVSYDQQTIDLYRQAIATHERLAPYLLDQVNNAVKTGDPIMRPLFFDFPRDQRTYTIADEWLLGPAVLAAPQLTDAATRNVYLPAGTWFDVNHNKVIHGPKTLAGYGTPLEVTPTFVNMTAPGARQAITELTSTTN